MDYVMGFEETKECIRNINPYFDFAFVQYKNQNKNHIMVGIGCTGGHHRSVSITNWLYAHYKDQYHCYKSHRDKKWDKTNEKCCCYRWRYRSFCNA